MQKEDAVTANYTRTMTRQLVSETSFGYRNTPEVAPSTRCPIRSRSCSADPTGWVRLGSLYHTADAQPARPVSAVDVHRCAGDGARRRVGRAVPIDAIDLRWSLQNNVTWTPGGIS